MHHPPPLALVPPFSRSLLRYHDTGLSIHPEVTYAVNWTPLFPSVVSRRPQRQCAPPKRQEDFVPRPNIDLAAKSSRSSATLQVLPATEHSMNNPPFADPCTDSSVGHQQPNLVVSPPVHAHLYTGSSAAHQGPIRADSASADPLEVPLKESGISFTPVRIGESS